MAGDDDKKIHPWVLLVAALIGGGGANLGWNVAKPPRPDPHTGSMDAQIMAEERKAQDQHRKNIWSAIDNLQSDYASMQSAQRITNLQIDRIEKDVDGIKSSMDDHHAKPWHERAGWVLEKIERQHNGNP